MTRLVIETMTQAPKNTHIISSYMYIQNKSYRSHGKDYTKNIY